MDSHGRHVHTRGTPVLRRSTPIAATLLCLVFVTSSQSARNLSTSAVCGVKTYSYAGIQAATTAGGVSATLAATTIPTVLNGHVGAWIGLGGTQAGPGRTAEWIQVGLAAFTSDQTESYYEVTQAGSPTRFTESDSNIARDVPQHFAVLEMVNRRSWWRVWVNGKAVTSPIRSSGQRQHLASPSRGRKPGRRDPRLQLILLQLLRRVPG